MSLLRRHRAVRDVPEGDVITKTESETGENPKPARESATKPKQAPKDDK